MAAVPARHRSVTLEILWEIKRRALLKDLRSPYPIIDRSQSFIKLPISLKKTNWTSRIYISSRRYVRYLSVSSGEIQEI